MNKKMKYTIVVSAALLLLAGGSTIYALKHAGSENNIPDEKKLDKTETQTIMTTDTAGQEAHKQNTPEKENNKTETVAQGQTDKPASEQSTTSEQSNSGSQQPTQPQQSNTSSQQPAQTQQSNNTAQQPTQTQQSNNAAQQTTQEATTEETTTEHTPVWVVDEPAWDEVWDEYEDVEVVICNDCGADITNDLNHFEDGVDENGIFTCWGYHSEWKQVLVEHHVDHHEEIGHWE